MKVMPFALLMIVSFFGAALYVSSPFVDTPVQIGDSVEMEALFVGDMNNPFVPVSVIWSEPVTTTRPVLDADNALDFVGLRVFFKGMIPFMAAVYAADEDNYRIFYIADTRGHTVRLNG